MTPLDWLILSTAIAIASLVGVSIINEKDRRRRDLQSRVSHLKLRAHNLEELVGEVDQLVEGHQVAKLINDEILEIATEMKAEAPEATYLDATYQSALARNDSLTDEALPDYFDRLKESDAKIARAQKHLNEAANLIKQLQSRNKLSVEEMSACHSQLSWAHLMVDVISHIGQGHKASNRKDVLSAQAFYKRSQQLLMQSSHPDKRRHRMIKELAEILNGKRAFLSEDLMPETQYNPTKAIPQPIPPEEPENGGNDADNPEANTSATGN